MPVLMGAPGRYEVQPGNRVLGESVRPEGARPVLDVGCETETHLFLSGSSGYGVDVDSSADMFRIAQPRLASSGNSSILLARAWAEVLPFQGNSFNLVFSVISGRLQGA